MNGLRLSSFLLGLVAVASCPSDGRADVGGCQSGAPCYLRCEYALTPPVGGCQYRFAPAGAADHPLLQFHLVDDFDVPVPGWIVEFELVPVGGSLVCQCAGSPSAISDAGGNGEVSLGYVGGKGEFDLVVYGTEVGTTQTFEIGFLSGFQFTSVDQNATCDPLEPATTILDLGVWAQGLPPQPYARTSDFNCDGTVNIIDLGAIAAGLNHGCTP